MPHASMAVSFWISSSKMLLIRSSLIRSKPFAKSLLYNRFTPNLSIGRVLALCPNFSVSLSLAHRYGTASGSDPPYALQPLAGRYRSLYRTGAPSSARNLSQVLFFEYFTAVEATTSPSSNRRRHLNSTAACAAQLHIPAARREPGPGHFPL